MPLGQFQDIHRTDPEGRVNPRFRHHLIRFRHFIDGSLALASLNRTCRNHRPDVSAALTTVAFDQSGPRWLGISDLIAEPRRTSLLLLYSRAQPFGPATLRDTRPTADVRRF